jgi:hypothetical protein
MTDLIAHAEKLATEPPEKVYKKIMQLFSEAQLAELANSETKYKDVLESDKKWFEENQKQAKAIANIWDQTVQDLGLGVAQFKATATCDFVAMCMMMIAAGSARVEDLKAVVRDGKPSGTSTTPTDRAYVFERGQTKKFLETLDAWCKLENNGIVQFKFLANSDYHTFAVERAPDQKGQTAFIVYQGYQNTYSLSHFLAVQDLWNDFALNKVHWQQFASLNKNEKGRYKSGYQDYSEKVVLPQLKKVSAAVECVGGEQRLTRETLGLNVLEPLGEMLAGKLGKAVYSKMTGSSTSNDVSTNRMIVLMCDQVDPKTFEANRKALYDCPNDLTIYPV